MSRSKNKKNRNPKATISMKRVFYTLNGGLYIKDREENTMITEENYRNFLGANPLMKKGLGAKERMYRGYNSKGEMVVNKIISTSPDRSTKIYTYFMF